MRGLANASLVKDETANITEQMRETIEQAVVRVGCRELAKLDGKKTTAHLVNFDLDVGEDGESATEPEDQHD